MDSWFVSLLVSVWTASVILIALQILGAIGSALDVWTYKAPKEIVRERRREERMLFGTVFGINLIVLFCSYPMGIAASWTYSDFSTARVFSSPSGTMQGSHLMGIVIVSAAIALAIFVSRLLKEPTLGSADLKRDAIDLATTNAVSPDTRSIEDLDEKWKVAHEKFERESKKKGFRGNQGSEDRRFTSGWWGTAGRTEKLTAAVQWSFGRWSRALLVVSVCILSAVILWGLGVSVFVACEAASDGDWARAGKRLLLALTGLTLVAFLVSSHLVFRLLQLRYIAKSTETSRRQFSEAKKIIGEVRSGPEKAILGKGILGKTSVNEYVYHLFGLRIFRRTTTVKVSE